MDLLLVILCCFHDNFLFHTTCIKVSWTKQSRFSVVWTRCCCRAISPAKFRNTYFKTLSENIVLLWSQWPVPFLFLWELEAMGFYPNSSHNLLKENCSPFLLCVALCCQPQLYELVWLWSQKWGLGWHGDTATCVLGVWRGGSFSELYSRRQHLSCTGGYLPISLDTSWFEVEYDSLNSSDRKEMLFCSLSEFIYNLLLSGRHIFTDAQPWALDSSGCSRSQ